jgi:soluble lytic murein transglycosylase-like protein
MRRRLPQIGLLAALLAAPVAVGSEIRSWTDKDGVIHFTNVGTKGSNAAKKHGNFKAPPRANASTGAPARTVRVSREEYDSYIRAAARRYKIPEALVWAVMHTESNFDPGAISRVGASGLMQLMPATAEEMHVTDIFDVRQNIEGGTRYLRVLANEFDGDMVKMLAAYNAGPHNVKKYGGQIPPFAETQAYVRKVIQRYFEYKKKHQQAVEEKIEFASADDAGSY